MDIWKKIRSRVRVLQDVSEEIARQYAIQIAPDTVRDRRTGIPVSVSTPTPANNSAPTEMDQRRLEFARWLVERGILSDFD